MYFKRLDQDCKHNCKYHCREEAQAAQEEQQYHKLHQKQVQAQQDSAWMHSVPEWHDAELVGQNKPWTVPSQLLTAEEEVRLILVLGTQAVDVTHKGAQRDRVAQVAEPGSGFRVLWVLTAVQQEPWTVPLQLLAAEEDVQMSGHSDSTMH